MSKKKKILLNTFAITFSLWFLFLALTPTLLAHGGLKLFFKKKYNGTLCFDKAHLSWFRAQSLKGVRYESKSKSLKLTADHFETSASLLSLISNPKNLKELTLEGVDGSYYLQPIDASSKQPSTSEREAASPFWVLSAPYIGKLQVQNSQFRIYTQNKEPVIFKSIQMSAQYEQLQGPLYASIACESSQSDLAGSLYFSGELGGFNSEGKLALTPQDTDLFYLSPKAYLNLDAQITNLPTTGIDALSNFYFNNTDTLASSLLGESLNLGAQFSANKGNSSLSINASSKTLDLAFKGNFKEDRFVVDESSYAKLTLDQHSSKAFKAPYDQDLKLADRALATLNVERLVFPLNSSALDLKALSCNLTLALKELHFAPTSKLSHLQLDSLEAVLDSFAMGEQANLHLKSSAQHQGQKMALKIDTQFSRLGDVKSVNELSNLKTQSNLKLENMSSELIDQYLGSPELFKEILGPNFHLSGQFQGCLEKGESTFSLDSSRVRFSGAKMLHEKLVDIKLQHPLHLETHIHPTLAEKITNPNFTLLHPFEMKLGLKKLHLSLNQDKLIQDIELKAHLNPFEALYKTSKPVHISDSHIHVFKNEENEIQTDASMTATLPQEVEPSILSESIDLSLLWKKKLSSANGVASEFQALLENSQLNLSVEGHILANHLLEIKKAKALYQGPFPTGPAFLSAANDEPFEVTLNPTTLDLSNNPFFKIEGRLSHPYAELIVGDYTHKLGDFTLPFSYQSETKELNFETANEDHSSALKGALKEISLTPAFNAGFSIDLKTKLSSLDFLPQNQRDWVPSGPFTLYLKAEGSAKDSITGQMQVEVKSKELFAKGSLAVDHEIFLLEPLTVHLNSIDSELAKSWMKKLHLSDAIRLSEKAQLHLSLNRLHAPKVFPIQSSSLCQGDLKLSAVSLYDTTFKDLCLSIEQSLNSQDLHLSIQATTPHKKQKLGKALCELTLSHENGITTYNGHLDASLIPTQLIERCCHSLGAPFNNWNQFLGHLSNFSADFKFQQGLGPLFIDFETPFAKSSLNLFLNQNLLQLQEDTSITLAYHEGLKERFLKGINPFMAYTKPQRQKMILDLPKGLQLHLNNPKNPCTLTKATLHVPQMTLLNAPSIKQLLALFDVSTKQKQIDFWLGDLEFSYDQNRVQVSDTHFLLHNRFHLVTAKEFDKDFTLSLAPKTLERSFHIPITAQADQIVFDLETTPIGFDTNWNLAQEKIESSFQRFSLLKAASTQSLEDSQELSFEDEEQEPVEDSLQPWDEQDASSNYTSENKTNSSEQSKILNSFFQALKKTFKMY